MLLRNAGVLLFLVFIFSGCSKDDPDLANSAKILGTWNVESFVVTNPTETIDIYAFFADFEPCVRENRLTFSSDGTYAASVPADCVDEDGQSLLLFPASESGSYTITEEGKLTITDIDGSYEGDYVFETNNKLVLSTVEGSNTIELTFIRK